MTDEIRRSRHGSHGAPDAADLERLRYFTQPHDDRPTTRHRRRREPHQREPHQRAPQTVTNRSATEPVTRRMAPVPQQAPPVSPPRARPRVIPPVAPAVTDDHVTETAPVESVPVEPDVVTPDAVTPDIVTPVTAPPRYVEAPPVVDDETIYDDDVVTNEVYSQEVFADEIYADDVYHEDAFTEVIGHPGEASPTAAPDSAAPVEQPRPVRGRPSSSTIRRRRAVLAVVLTCLLVAVLGVGYFGLKMLGIVGADDYDNAAGTGDVVVQIPQNSTLRDFGNILVDNDVVASAKAFTKAADGQAISGGYYKLRTEIPAATAVAMMTDADMAHRVGRMVVPEGLQLDTKEGVDGKSTPGIFQMISNATSVTIDGRKEGVTVEQLEQAAASGSADELGIPTWARDATAKLAGDHRRVEGLISPGTWEYIDPRATPVQILHDLIVASAAHFEQWGLLNDNGSGLTPYETLVAASVVEREVTQPDDYSKVARVILNRLDEGQRLEMDSTANYTAAVTNIDLSGDAYKADNEWNTYRIKGLPVTPIGAVGERALEATEKPAEGKWLYFVTVDKQGTTLFADDFEEHKRNREKACENGLLTTGCS